MEYTTRKTSSKFRTPVSIIISLSIGVLLLFLVFSTDNIYDVQESDIATVSVTYPVSRDSSVEVVQEAKEQINTENSTIVHSEAASLDGVEYYDVEVPYKLTCGEIGGLLEGEGRWYGTIYKRSKYVESSNVGDLVLRETSPGYIDQLFDKPGTRQIKLAQLVVADGRQMDTVIPKMGVYQGRYLSAIQPYYYEQPGAYYTFEECVGNYFDVVLTDGTVIPFIVMDGNAREHTNQDTSESSAYWEQYNQKHPSNTNKWPTGKLNIEKYKHLFDACGGHSLELLGKEGCVEDFKNHYGLGTTTHIAYYRMYNKRVFD